LVATLRFEVENAGCPSCGERVQGALTSLGIVDEITIDEKADTATVSMRIEQTIEEPMVNSALAAASTGAGHLYRVRSGSWATSV
jgi:hypothetical protein